MKISIPRGASLNLHFCLVWDVFWLLIVCTCCVVKYLWRFGTVGVLYKQGNRQGKTSLNFRLISESMNSECLESLLVCMIHSVNQELRNTLNPYPLSSECKSFWYFLPCCKTMFNECRVVERGTNMTNNVSEYLCVICDSLLLLHKYGWLCDDSMSIVVALKV